MILTALLKLDPSLSKKISFVCGGIWSFFGNKFFTFRKNYFKISEPALFMLIYLIGFLLNSYSHDFILKILPFKITAFGIATILSIIWNYVGQKWFVFRVKK